MYVKTQLYIDGTQAPPVPVYLSCPAFRRTDDPQGRFEALEYVAAPESFDPVRAPEDRVSVVEAAGLSGACLVSKANKVVEAAGIEPFLSVNPNPMMAGCSQTL